MLIKYIPKITMMKSFFILFFLITFSGMEAQIIKTKLDIVGGISAREYLHGGLRYQYTNRTQFGLYYGGDIDLYPEVIRTYCIDNMIHFGNHSFSSNRPVWYARQGYTYAVNTEVDKKRKFSYVNLGIGREFGIKDWLGFNIDLGFIMQIREKDVMKDLSIDPTYKTAIQWMPMLRLQVFFSL